MDQHVLRIVPASQRPRSDVAANTFFAEVESDLRVAGSMGGLHGMLAYLNARTRFRFTGVYSIGRAPHIATYLYDRDVPALASADHRQLNQLGAAIARAEMLVDAGADAPQLADLSIAGIGAPLIDRAGRGWGILCHFDARLRIVPDRELDVLMFLGKRASHWIEPRNHGSIADHAVEL